MSQQPALITLKENLQDIEIDNNVRAIIQAAQLSYPAKTLNKIKYVLVQNVSMAFLLSFLSAGKTFSHTKFAQDCFQSLQLRQRQAIDRMLGESLEQNIKAAEHHQYLLKDMSQNMDVKQFEPTRIQVNNQSKKLHIDYNKVSYKNEANLTLRKNISPDKDFISIIGGAFGAKDPTTIICFYQYLPDEVKQQRRQKQPEPIKHKQSQRSRESLQSRQSYRSVDSDASRSQIQPPRYSGNIIDRVATIIIQVILLILGLALLVYLITEVLHNQGIAHGLLPERKQVKWFIRGFLMDLPELNLDGLVDQ